MIQQDLLLCSQCTRFLSHHGAADARALLRGLADHPLAGSGMDFFGAGGAVESLEVRVSALLGKESALFFLKGVTAQLALLRTLAEGQDGAIAIAALSHMAVDEEDAVTHLVDAPIAMLGDAQPFGVAEIARLDPCPAVCVVELPLRRAAYRLPAYAELEALSRWCRDHRVHLHFDGARLWEAAAGYGVSPATLAALADSLYVSFYKGLGGLAGAALVGEQRLLAAVRVWKTRLGGNLHTAFPYALSALHGLDLRLPRMADYVDRARALARHLTRRGLTVVPAMPDVNAFQLWLPGDAGALMQASRAFAGRHGIWLFNDFRPAPREGYAAAEIVVGDAALGLGGEEIGGWIDEVLERAPR